MVNIQPIPPLLCSTPPPIDFGEEDEDIDVLPPSLVGMEDGDFGDFLAEDDIKTSESLPSPSPPSICDLPPISIYDGLMSADEENLITHITASPPSPTDNKINKKFEQSTKSNITEAFNYNVRNTNNETQNLFQNESKSQTVEPKDYVEKIEAKHECETTATSETEVNKCPRGSRHVKSEDIENLRIESVNVASEGKSNRSSISCIQNLVSIEDIEDDLSDYELYSPKTPKNFTAADNFNDYFKIEEIKTLNTTGTETKLNSMDVDSKSLNSLDNNESVLLKNENDHEFNSFSSNSFMGNKFDMPSSLKNDANSNDYDNNDDDFGEFADFQDSHFVNNTVPVNDNTKQHRDLELDNFNDVNQYNATVEIFANGNINANKANESDCEVQLKDSENLKKDVNGSTSNSATVSDNFKIPHEEISKQNSLSSQIKCDDLPIDETCENKQSLKEISRKEVIDEKVDFGNFAEFSNSSVDYENINVGAIEDIKEPTKFTEELSHDDDDFGDFADFESNQQETKSGGKISLCYESGEDGGETAEDDFGDFNEAEPITATTSSLTLSKTSQNTNIETPVLPLNNLNERISKILQLMFPLTVDPAEQSSDEPKSNKIQDIPFTSIDTAKALEYQWLISDTRHTFIRSLGIDSKNILFGDNWNPSLPRFAANLSFNPLKPIKPVQCSNSTADTSPMLEPIPIDGSETSQSLEITCNMKKETMDLEMKPPRSTEQTTDAFKNSTVNSASSGSTSMSYISSEPPLAEPESLKKFENLLENEEKYSKTPPISEMESVATFSSPLPTATMVMELPTTAIELEEDLKNTVNMNEVVVTSTFTGSFKETHIFTPPQINDFESKHATAVLSTLSSSPTKASPIDFDYEKAAMGVIIDETVVKKEYRDVEYNPPFSMESLNKSAASKVDMFETNSYVNTNTNILSSTDINVVEEDEEETSDDFSEFQSVSSDVVVSGAAAIPKTTEPSEVPTTTSVSHGGMILSPAILIPQAISMESQKPKIEWGDSTASINPEELARIEELFPEPKSLKSNGSNSSQKSTPTRQVASTPSISATVANKELEAHINNINNDDDDWSDFVSVTITNTASDNKSGSNNNIFAKSPSGSPFQQRSPFTHRMSPPTHSNSNNDDEWSEFVSSAPPLQQQQPTSYRVPQFNSGAWQNANFYNNPLSMYHKGPLNIPPGTAATTHSIQKYLYNNNNNYNISQQPYQIPNNMPPVMLADNQQTPNNAYQQQVHVMQNFSTAPVPAPPERLSATASSARNNQFQSIGSAKVAPSIALIPDLGFVAPAIPTHTSFINSLPKPSIKK